MVVGATLATCALAALTHPEMATASPAAFERVVASDFQTNRYVAPVIDSFGGVTVFSETDQTKATYHLAAVVGDRRARLPIEPRQRVPFDVDLGSDGKGGVVAAYSRCRVEPSSSRASLYAQPYPAWTTARGCDLYRYDFSTGRERKISGASTSGASEMLPSIWKGNVAFARVYERRSGRRGVYPYLYVRSMSAGAKSDRQPGGNRGELGLPGPTRLDLYGRRLSFVWNHATEVPVRSGRPAGVSEVRLDSVGGEHRVLSSARWRDPFRDYASFISPRGAEGYIYYGFDRVAIRDIADVRTKTALLARYRLSNGDKSLAGAPPLMIDTATDAGKTYIGTSLDTFDPSGPGFVLRHDAVDWKD